MTETVETGEEPRVRVVVPPYEVGTRHEIVKDEWVVLTGCDTPELVEETIREAVGPGDWEIIQTDNLPTGLGEDADSLAEYVATAEQADRDGIPMCVYLAVCEDHSMTVDPDTIHYYGEGRDDEDIAIAALDSYGSIEEMLGDRVESYIDWDKLGRDLRLGDGFEIVEGTIIQVQ